MHSSLSVRRVAALALVLSVCVLLSSCKSTSGATSPAGSIASPKLMGKWAPLPGDAASLEPTGTPDSSGTLRGYLVGTHVFSTQEPGAPDSEAYMVRIRWGDVEANNVTDMALSDSTEVAIDGNVVPDPTAAGKRAALDPAVARAEFDEVACRAIVVYEPGPDRKQDDPGFYPIPVLRKILVESP